MRIEGAGQVRVGVYEEVAGWKGLERGRGTEKREKREREEREEREGERIERA